MDFYSSHLDGAVRLLTKLHSHECFHPNDVLAVALFCGIDTNGQTKFVQIVENFLNNSFIGEKDNFITVKKTLMNDFNHISDMHTICETFIDQSRDNLFIMDDVSSDLESIDLDESRDVTDIDSDMELSTLVERFLPQDKYNDYKDCPPSNNNKKKRTKKTPKRIVNGKDSSKNVDKKYCKLPNINSSLYYMISLECQYLSRAKAYAIPNPKKQNQGNWDGSCKPF